MDEHAAGTTGQLDRSAAADPAGPAPRSGPGTDRRSATRRRERSSGSTSARSAPTWSPTPGTCSTCCATARTTTNAPATGCSGDRSSGCSARASSVTGQIWSASRRHAPADVHRQAGRSADRRDGGGHRRRRRRTGRAVPRGAARRHRRRAGPDRQPRDHAGALRRQDLGVGRHAGDRRAGRHRHRGDPPDRRAVRPAVPADAGRPRVPPRGAHRRRRAGARRPGDQGAWPTRATTSSPRCGRPATDDGRQLDERQVRDDTVAMFAATTETTINVLTWLWPHLDEHPDVADQLYARDRPGGRAASRSRREHLRELRYTRMVLDELLRLYPVGWLIPRRVVADGRHRRRADRGRRHHAGSPLPHPAAGAVLGPAGRVRPGTLPPGTRSAPGTGTPTSPSAAARTSASGCTCSPGGTADHGHDAQPVPLPAAPTGACPACGWPRRCGPGTGRADPAGPPGTGGWAGMTTVDVPADGLAVGRRSRDGSARSPPAGSGTCSGAATPTPTSSPASPSTRPCSAARAGHRLQRTRGAPPSSCG